MRIPAPRVDVSTFPLKFKAIPLQRSLMLSFLRKRMGPDGVPMPPDKLMKIVSGWTDHDWFIRGGKLGADCVVNALKRNGIELHADSRILDFGCGCGRVLRHLRETGWQLFGSDYHSGMIRWNRKAMPFANFEVNGLEPPFKFAENQFDLAYAFSVFTHLPMNYQQAWRDELFRVLKPNGVLIITTHGEHYRDSDLNDAEKETFNKNELVVRGGDRSGESACATFQTEALTDKIFGGQFEKIEFVVQGATGNPLQDLHVYRSRKQL